MKNNYIILWAIFIIFNPGKLLLPHNEFTVLVNGVAIKNYVVDTTIYNPNVIKWSPDDASNLQIYSNNLLLDDNFPIDELNTPNPGPDAVNAINGAAIKWNEAAPQNAIILNTSVESNNNAINIRFSVTEGDFDNMSEYAKTHLSTNAGGIWAVSSSYIVFNACDARYWKWTDQSQFLPFDSTGWVDWESVCLHELGHVLGLAECTIADAVMNAGLSSGQTRPDLTKYDYAGLHYMWRLIFEPPGVYPQSFLLTDPSIGFMRKTNNKGIIE